MMRGAAALLAAAGMLLLCAGTAAGAGPAPAGGPLLASPFPQALPGRGAALAAAVAATPAPGAPAPESEEAAGLEGPAASAEGPFAAIPGAGAERLDGVSDQNLAEWDSPAGGYLRQVLAGRWMTAGGIRMARYVVPWDIATAPAERSYLVRYEAWHAVAVGELGLVPVIAVGQYPGGRVPASAAEYRLALTALLHLEPVRWLEAWNEPDNRPLIAPDQAAAYLREAQGLCAAAGCGVIAGDLLDTPGMAAYEARYLAALGPVLPGDWGIHPYRSVRAHDLQGVRSFLAELPLGGAGARVWVTEVGAYACRPRVAASVREQALDTSWLVNRLLPALEPAHAFYYGFLGAGGHAVACPARYEDTKLYASAPGGVDLPRPAAAFAFSGHGEPAAYTGGALALGGGRVQLLGSVLPGGLQPASWRFLYGPTAAFGHSTPWVAAAASELPQAVAAVAGGLAPGATVHYLLEAANGEGSSAEGPAPGAPRTLVPGP